MPRLIRTKITAALALAGVLQKMNNNILQLDLEEGMDGIVQLAGELVDTSFQLQQDPSKLAKLERQLARMEYIITEGLLVHHQTSAWERMLRLAKLEEIKAQLHEAGAMLMAYRELPKTLVRKRIKVEATPTTGQPTGRAPGTSATL